MTVIRKIRLNEKLVAIKFTRLNGGTKEEIDIHSEEAPRPEFASALQSLAAHVVAICELPAGYEKNLTVLGVSFSDQDGTLGAVISAKKKLKTSRTPLVIHTPYKAETDIAHRVTDKTLTVECSQILRKLIGEAEQFIKGRRSQQDMFTEPEPPAAEGGEGGE